MATCSTTASTGVYYDNFIVVYAQHVVELLFIVFNPQPLNFK